jgi:carbon-monoxide dehydrogenase medium subunit
MRGGGGPPATWLRPVDLDDAVAMVARGATPVSGATALMSRAFELSFAPVVADVRDILDAGIDGHRVGAATTLAALTSDRQAADRWPGVAAAAGATANPGVRALATVGGTVAARQPGADLAAAWAAYDASVSIHRLSGDGGPVTLAVADYLAVGVAAPHLVTAVTLGAAGPGAYRRFVARPGPAPALATVAGTRTPAGAVRLWAGACGLTPAPIPFPPEMPPGESVLRSDARASAAYRAQLIAVLAGEVVDELAAA